MKIHEVKKGKSARDFFELKEKAEVKQRDRGAGKTKNKVKICELISMICKFVSVYVGIRELHFSFIG